MKMIWDKTLADYPDIQRAIQMDGAIRRIDGRWSDGYVSIPSLDECVESGLLVLENLQGWTLAMRPRGQR